MRAVLCWGEAEVLGKVAGEGLALGKTGSMGHIVDAHLPIGHKQFASVVQSAVVDEVGD